MEIESINIPKILFIKGVFKKDCIFDDIFEKKILENVEEDNDKSNEMINDMDSCYNKILESNTAKSCYKKLPSIFYDLESWVENTNLLCWYCNLNFDTVPIFIPNVIEPNLKKNNDNSKKLSIGVYGVYCSFGCANQYIKNNNNSIIKITESLNKLKFLYKIFYGHNNMPDYLSYPEPYIMFQYGGNKSIEEYKILITQFNNAIR
jgi:hypothetical protein